MYKIIAAAFAALALAAAAEAAQLISSRIVVINGQTSIICTYRMNNGQTMTTTNVGTTVCPIIAG
jgi:hypothetical protein